MWFIILHLGVNVHRYFAVLMACQILNRFRVNGSVNEVGDIGMPELMGRHLEADAVHHVFVVSGPLPQHGGHGMRNLLAVDIAVIGPQEKIFPELKARGEKILLDESKKGM